MKKINLKSVNQPLSSKEMKDVLGGSPNGCDIVINCDWGCAPGSTCVYYPIMQVCRCEKNLAVISKPAGNWGW